MNFLLLLAAIIASLCASAFFSGSETGLLTVRRIHPQAALFSAPPSPSPGVCLTDFEHALISRLLARRTEGKAFTKENLYAALDSLDATRSDSETTFPL